jgi:glycosyltransferase involved in cell wall biosynthesis
VEDARVRALDPGRGSRWPTVSALRRFAMVTPNFHPRVCGIGDYSARLGAELHRRGHAVSFFSRNPVGSHPVATELEVHGVSGRFPLEIARAAVPAIRDWRPTDVLIQYTPQMWDAWRFGSPAMVWLAAQTRRPGVRVTLVAHELFIPWDLRPDLLLGAGSQRIQLAAMLKSVDRIFVTTDTRARSIASVCRLLGLPEPGVVRVGANALPIERRRRPTTSTGAPRIGFFSTAAANKRFDVVLDAFGRIVAEHPSAELVLIGDLGPSELPRVRTIVDAVARHPAGARIRMTGKLSLSEIASQLADLDLYLFPMDTGANTRSSTLPSALGSALPVIAVVGADTDLTLFRDGENVVFAREMSGPAFAEASLRLLRNPQLMAEIGDNARRLYEVHMTWERIADRLLAG